MRPLIYSILAAKILLICTACGPPERIDGKNLEEWKARIDRGQDRIATLSSELEELKPIYEEMDRNHSMLRSLSRWMYCEMNLNVPSLAGRITNKSDYDIREFTVKVNFAWQGQVTGTEDIDIRFRDGPLRQEEERRFAAHASLQEWGNIDLRPVTGGMFQYNIISITTTEGINYSYDYRELLDLRYKVRDLERDISYWEDAIPEAEKNIQIISGEI